MRSWTAVIHNCGSIMAIEFSLLKDIHNFIYSRHNFFCSSFYDEFSLFIDSKKCSNTLKSSLMLSVSLSLSCGFNKSYTWSVYISIYEHLNKNYFSTCCYKIDKKFIIWILDRFRQINHLKRVPICLPYSNNRIHFRIIGAYTQTSTYPVYLDRFLVDYYFWFLLSITMLNYNKTIKDLITIWSSVRSMWLRLLLYAD